MSSQLPDPVKILPHEYPFLMIDRVVEMGDDRVVCVKTVSEDEECLLEKVFFPEVLIVEAMAQSSGMLLIGESAKGGFLSSLRDVVFHNRVKGGDTLMIHSSLVHRMPPLFAFEVKVTVDDTTVAEGALSIVLLQ